MICQSQADVGQETTRQNIDLFLTGELDGMT